MDDDDELVETDVPTVGEQLRSAREAKGMSLEDVAAQTRIPRRHLESLETSDWDKLPAPTYTIGFARSYAAVVELDRAEIADQLRGELGDRRPAAAAEVFEPIDPARTMPKWLVFGAIGAVVLLVILMTWLSNRSLDGPDQANTVATVEAPPPAQPASPPAAVAQQPVVVTSTEAVWLQITDKGATIYSGVLQPGQSYQVPATAAVPLLKTGKPEGLQVRVGNSVAPPIGPPATTVTVSLLPADLMRGGQAAAPAPPPSAAPIDPAPRSSATRLRQQIAPAPATPEPAPTPPTSNTGE